MIPRIIMSVLGFKVDQSVYEAFKKQKVVIFPHTSKLECIIGCMGFWISGNRKNIIFPVAQEYMETPILGSCLEYFGAVKILKGTGMTSSLIEYMRKNPNKILMVSPEGSLSPREWKSGFFYIARELNLPIHVGGVDFVNHKLICNLEKSIIPGPNDQFKEKLDELHEMFINSEVHPLYPEKSNPVVLMKPGMIPRCIPLNRKIFIQVCFIAITGIIYSIIMLRK